MQTITLADHSAEELPLEQVKELLQRRPIALCFAHPWQKYTDEQSGKLCPLHLVRLY